MPNAPIRKVDLAIHGKSRTINNDLLGDSIINDAKVASDAAIQKSKILNLVSDLETINTNITNLQTEVNATQTGAGLSETGAYVANTNLPLINVATSLFNADAIMAQKIQDILNTDIANLQTELNTTQTGAGLSSTGTYVEDASLPYINIATSLFNADSILAQKIKEVIDSSVSTNTPDTIVRRDTNGDFSANKITAVELVSEKISGGEETPGSITTTYTDSYYLNDATSLHSADLILDAKIASMNAKKSFCAFIDSAVGGETFLEKPADAPPIPDNDDVELYIDGRKVRKGANKVFTVQSDGSRVNFSALSIGQDVELRYVAYDGATTPSDITINVGGGSSSGAGSGTTFTTYQINVGTTATQINTPEDTVNRIYAIQNTGEVVVYIGSTSAVSSTSGFALSPGDTFQITLTTTGALWGRTAAGITTLSVAKGS